MDATARQHWTQMRIVPLIAVLCFALLTTACSSTRALADTMNDSAATPEQIADAVIGVLDEAKTKATEGAATAGGLLTGGVKVWESGGIAGVIAIIGAFLTNRSRDKKRLARGEPVGSAVTHAPPKAEIT